MIDRELRDQMATHWPTLVRFAYQLTHDQGRAEDLVQDTYERILRTSGTGDHRIDSFGAYARTALVRLYMRQLRRQTVAVTELPDEMATDASPSDFTVTVEDRELIWALLGQLSDRDRSVLVLRYYVDWSDLDIAELLGCAPTTIRSLAHRTIRKIRRLAGNRTH